MDKGKVYFVGAGPGEPELITVKGLNLLKGADVVIYDYLVNSKLLDFVRPDAKLICCDALGKGYRNGFLVSQEKINRLMLSEARQKKSVLRLKNGDPLIFGRLSQEMEFLAKHNIPFEIIPGVTAASGAAAYSGIALTDRRFASSFCLVTGHEAPGKAASGINWKALSEVGTLAFYMGVETLDDLVKNLIESGKTADTPVAIVENATLPNQRTVVGRLKDISFKVRTAKIRPPAVTIVGKVARSTNRLNWFKDRPRILFTGLEPRDFNLKGRVFHEPLIKIMPLDDYSEADAHIRQIKNYDWLIFTSRFGVKYFFERLDSLKLDSRHLFGLKIAAIGRITKEALTSRGIIADCLPAKMSSSGLAEALRGFNLLGAKVIHFSSSLSTETLGRALEEQGARVTRVVIYKNLPAKAKKIDLNMIDEVVFTSGSTVRNFIRRYGKVPKHITVKCIGRPTLQVAKRAGLRGVMLKWK